MMASTIHYTQCPVCSSASIQQVLVVRDHSITNETFAIMQCNLCSLRFTQDVPDSASIGSYYKSDNYISHSNTSKGFINRLYQVVRQRTIRNKRKLVERITNLEHAELLDLGCGTGTFVHEMHKHGWKVTALEPDPGARKIAKELYGIEAWSSEQLYELPESRFDAITMWHVLEHVHELQKYVSRLKSLLKENGRLIIAVPNYTSADAKAYGEFWAAYDVPRHLYHFSPRSMKILVENSGLKILHIRTMWYDSFYISILSDKYKKGKANLLTAFLNGLRSNIQAVGDKSKCSSIMYIIGK